MYYNHQTSKDKYNLHHVDFQSNLIAFHYHIFKHYDKINTQKTDISLKLLSALV